MANLNTAVIYLSIAVIYHGILILDNVFTAVNYRGIFIILAPGILFFFSWGKHGQVPSQILQIPVHTT